MKIILSILGAAALVVGIFLINRNAGLELYPETPTSYVNFGTLNTRNLTPILGTGSMKPLIPESAPNRVVAYAKTTPLPYENIQPNMVVIFDSKMGRKLIHRINSRAIDGTWTVSGDANQFSDFDFIDETYVLHLVTHIYIDEMFK